MPHEVVMRLNDPARKDSFIARTHASLNQSLLLTMSVKNVLQTSIGAFQKRTLQKVTKM